ncbi:hypothetical protein Ptr902_05927 [Pyrenophora tritici-repentis]|nr:hypothetical protein Ptr902_05927 [Pyrenophora tritici-repentis]
MMPSPSLNISCSCKACSTFLRPTVSATQPYLLSLFSLPTTSTSDFTTKKKLLPTPSWVDRLSLSAYDVEIITPATSTPFQIPLSLNTSSLKKAEESQITRSAFPKTPGTLRCTHADCRTRIPVALSLPGVGSVSIESLLCEEHCDDVLYDAEEDIVDAPFSEKDPKTMMMAETTAFHSSESGVFSAESGVRGGGKASRKTTPALARRASSTASWSSVASLDGSEPSKSGDVGFEWAARAFESKLCW